MRICQKLSPRRYRRFDTFPRVNTIILHFLTSCMHICISASRPRSVNAVSFEERDTGNLSLLFTQLFLFGRNIRRLPPLLIAICSVSTCLALVILERLAVYRGLLKTNGFPIRCITCLWRFQCPFKQGVLIKPHPSAGELEVCSATAVIRDKRTTRNSLWAQ